MPDRDEQLVGDAQLLARVDAPALAAQPLAVEQVRAGELRPQPGAAEPLDRLAVEAARPPSPSLSSARDARLDAERPVGCA